ncbi:hypothetical protein GQ457_14G004340 [Hibiscus cannabinus]
MRNWRKRSLFDCWKRQLALRLCGTDFMHLRFACESDYERVLAGGSWVVYGNYLTVQPWSRSFSTSIDHPTRVLAWVRLPGLPYRSYTKGLFKYISELIGEVVKVDTNTAEGRRERFARLAVVVDLSKPLVAGLVIDGHKQTIEYEGLPVICFSCGKYGHMQEGCGGNEQTLERSTKSVSLGAEGGSVYGPWMQAQGRRPPGGPCYHEHLQRPVFLLIRKIRDLVISAGPIAAAKGKATAQTGVGSSKGIGLEKSRGSGEVYSSLEALKKLPSGDARVVLDVAMGANKENIDVNLPNPETSVAAKGSVIRMNSSLNRRSHMAVRIDEEGHRSVSKDIGDRSMSGPIRSSGTKHVNRMVASAKSIYKQGSRLHRKELKKGPDKPTLGDWLPSALNKIGGTGDADNGRLLEKDSTMGIKPVEDTAEATEGVLSIDFQNYFRLLLRTHRPDIFAIMEPRVSGDLADEFIRRSGFEFSYRVEANGFSGGIWILWKPSVSLDVLAVDSQFIHGACLVHGTRKSFFITFVYASPNAYRRSFVWDRIRVLEHGLDLPWILGGDFNVIGSMNERQGGSVTRYGVCSRFCDFLFQSGLVDMGFSGPKFTWRRGSLSQRLDRCLCNGAWISQFASSEVTHLQQLGSDHRPIMLSLFSNVEERCSRPFRFLDAWSEHPEFPTVVSNSWSKEKSMGENIFSFQKICNIWNRNSFGHIGRKKRRLLARIRGIEIALEKGRSAKLEELDCALKAELCTVLDQEESMWSQKSRNKWFQLGDRNTKYFHAVTMARRKRNTIRRLRLGEGEWCDDTTTLQSAAAEESVIHVLRDCVVAGNTWRRLVRPDKLVEFMALPFDEWLMRNLRGGAGFAFDAAGWGVLFPTICWTLWKTRCKQVMEPDSGVVSDPFFVGHQLVAAYAASVADGAKVGGVPHPPVSINRILVGDSCDMSTTCVGG